ncbi:MAG: CDP-alcohol phosphatidyltransferase family protein [Candidatus Saccharimonadales bacterium]
MERFLESCRQTVRRAIRSIARPLNRLTGGKLSPTMITFFGFAMHIPIALLIARGYFIYAALLLVFFGLFDTLDGELARIQGSSSKAGMLLDSVTDKMKEAILFIGVAYFFVWAGRPYMAVWAVVACGAGLLVSYVNAWGEVVTKDIKDDKHQSNKTFRNGIMTFDIRMLVIVVGLLANQLAIAVIFIAIMAWITALQRLRNIIQKLDRHAQN